MSKHKLEILKLLREINDLEKTNSLLLISSLYNTNDNNIINKNNLIISEKKKLLESINNNLKDKEKNKNNNNNNNNNNTNSEKKENEINDTYPRNDINQEKEIENKISLQELNMINKKELLKIKEDKRKAKELLYSIIH
jgi:hypothetical protein